MAAIPSWAELTQKQRKHLWIAAGQGINPNNKGLEIDEAALDSLQQLKLIHKTKSRKGRIMWKATDTGRGLVASRGLLPTFLNRRSELGYTHTQGMGLRGEPEAMPDDDWESRYKAA